MGVALQELGRPDEALPCFEKACQLQPDQADAHFSLATALKDVGDPLAAIACYERALRLEPDHAQALCGRGLAQLLTDGQIVTVYEPASFFWLGGGYLLGLPVSLFVVAAVAGLTGLLMKRTALGLFIQAVGINPVAARLAGVRTGSIVFFVYVYCSLGAGLAGLMIASNIKSADANNAGLLLELDAILAVTLGGGQLGGGRFSLAGSLVGALIIQTLTSTIYALGVPPQVTMVVKAVVVFAVCISQSSFWSRRSA